MNHFNSFLDVYTVAMRSNVELAQSLLNGARRMRQCQLDQINASASDCGVLNDLITSVQDADTLQATHTALLDMQMERTSAYWSGMATAVNETQAEMSCAVQGWCSAATDDLYQAIEQLHLGLAPESTSHVLPLLEPAHMFAFMPLLYNETRETLNPPQHNGRDHSSKSSNRRNKSAEKRVSA